jgi:N-acetylneuraminate synthase
MVFIIGEIGTNHLGDLNIAKKIIQCAVNTGFDAVKFQKKNVEKIYTQEFLNSPLDSPWGTTQREMRLHREFSDKQFESIDKFCKKLKIPWFVSCWDTESQLSMRKFNLKYNKVASAMIIHEKLLKIIAEEQKYTFISTGMSTLKEIKNAVEIFKKFNCPHELLHANSSYPMKTEEANLKLIPFLKKKFKCNVGYSGHETFASLISVTAVLQGASTVERHITIDRTAYGHDQAASLEPDGMKRLVRDIRILDKIMGDGKKKIYDSELPNMKKLRQIFV